MTAQPVPKGYHTVTPYLIIRGAAKALDYYQRAFDARELVRMSGPQGHVGHAEMLIGDSRIMLADELPNTGCVSPETLGGTPVNLLLYVPEVDRVFEQAVAAGGTAQQPVRNQFYGDRSGTVKDPFGHLWTISTHVEDVPPEELRQRAEAFMKETAGTGL